MKENIENITEFFPSSNLNNQLFYLYCPNLQSKERSKIYKSITNHHGVSQIIYYFLQYFIKLEIYSFI